MKDRENRIILTGRILQSVLNGIVAFLCFYFIENKIVAFTMILTLCFAITSLSVIIIYILTEERYKSNGE